MNMECGDDGCNGTCGDCEDGDECVEGWCVCPPDCAGRECGDDGCGGTCGDCEDGDECVEGWCVCPSDCADRECGDDGCGGTCGTCATDQDCAQGKCVGCYPDCDWTSCVATKTDILLDVVADDATFSAAEPRASSGCATGTAASPALTPLLLLGLVLLLGRDALAPPAPRGSNGRRSRGQPRPEWTRACQESTGWGAGGGGDEEGVESS
jgi:hypothetical protein